MSKNMDSCNEKKKYKHIYREKFRKKYADQHYSKLIDIFGTVIALEALIIFVQLFLIFYMFNHSWTMVIM